MFKRIESILLIITLFITAVSLLYLQHMLFQGNFFDITEIKKSILKNNDIARLIKNKNKPNYNLKIRSMTVSEENIKFPYFRKYNQKLLAITNYYSEQGEGGLNIFFDRLIENIESGKSNRIVINLMGDSLMSGDYIPGYFRDFFCGEFGNGGPGFQCIRRPNSSYYHADVYMRGSKWDLVSYLDIKLPDHYIGLNGFSFTGDVDDWSLIQTGRHSEFNNITLYYFKSPQKGKFEFTVGTNKTKIINTYYSKKKSAYYSVNYKHPQSKIKITVISNKVRMYGVSLYNDYGVVLNTFPYLGAEISKIPRIDRKMYIDQLRETQADFIVFMFWGNKATYSILEMDEYLPDLNEAFDRIQTALPSASVLVIGPMGVSRFRKGELEVKPIIYKMIKVQREVADQYGFAFLDLFKLTGGEKNIETWYSKKSDLIAPDRVHFTRKGSEIISIKIYQELMTAFHKYLIIKGHL